MGNVFPTETRLHRRYDLKGSTYGRTAGVKLTDPNATLKASLPRASVCHRCLIPRNFTHRPLGCSLRCRGTLQ